ncbi:hypothetical protein Ga0061061_11714 [Chelatococcus sambhunathii]|uniref:Uncharacterized protein n=2 Tax=Chelatococcus sambhunathii TaxID=363953 RepID=A0ABM9UI79_9HYPH|nr:hypothetical protein Ga0061061_11714 [Chelatococcus sambhunathii]
MKDDAAHDDAVYRKDQALLDSYEEAIEAAEMEIVEERAKVLKAEALAAQRYDELSKIVDEMRGLVDERNELAGELKDTETELRELEKKHEKLEETGREEMETFREALIDYLISIGEPVNCHLRASRELQALCDVVL